MTENRRPLIAGNWKLNKTETEAVDTARDLLERVAGVIDVDTMIAPPFTALSAVAKVVQGANVALGAQNIFWEDEGAYTGEISPAMLTAAGCTYVIIGHSERRQYFGETDQTVNKRIRAAVNHGLIPVLCVGESEAERDAEETFSVLDRQMENGLEGLTAGELDNLVVAYEPVWAIGTGKAATSDQAQEVHQYLRSRLVKMYGDTLAKQTKILYGGSVNPNNVKELMAKPDVDGALVGGASLSAETFSRLVCYRQ